MRNSLDHNQQRIIICTSLDHSHMSDLIRLAARNPVPSKARLSSSNVESPLELTKHAAAQTDFLKGLFEVNGLLDSRVLEALKPELGPRVQHCCLQSLGHLQSLAERCFSHNVLRLAAAAAAAAAA